MELALVLSKPVNGALVDGYFGNEQAWATRQQIGAALEYSEPQKAIDKIHAKHKERLDKFSVTTVLGATDGKQYKTRVYNTRGVLEICRWSRQPKADMVMDMLYDLFEEVRMKNHNAALSEKYLSGMRYQKRVIGKSSEPLEGIGMDKLVEMYREAPAFFPYRAIKAAVKAESLARAEVASEEMIGRIHQYATRSEYLDELYSMWSGNLPGFRKYLKRYEKEMARLLAV